MQMSGRSVGGGTRTGRSAFQVSASFALLMVLLATSALPPLMGASEEVAQRWEETRSFTGNCTLKPTHHYFQVNATAHGLVLDIRFTSMLGFPGADLTLHKPDSYVFESYYITETVDTIEVKDIPEWGRWSVTVSVTACGPTNPIEFVLDLTVRNRFIGSPVVVGEAVVGTTTELAIEGLSLGAGEMVRVQMDDEAPGNWTSSPTMGLVIGKGEHTVRAMVMLEDGSVTGWGEPTTIKVEEGGGRQEGGRRVLSVEGAAIAFVMVIFLGALTGLSRRW